MLPPNAVRRDRGQRDRAPPQNVVITATRKYAHRARDRELFVQKLFGCAQSIIHAALSPPKLVECANYAPTTGHLAVSLVPGPELTLGSGAASKTAKEAGATSGTTEYRRSLWYSLSTPNCDQFSAPRSLSTRELLVQKMLPESPWR